MFEKVSIFLPKEPNLGRFKKDFEKKKIKIFIIIAEIPKANYCYFFCFLLTIDKCIINVWGYTEILPTVLQRNLKEWHGGHGHMFACAEGKQSPQTLTQIRLQSAEGARGERK